MEATRTSNSPAAHSLAQLPRNTSGYLPGLDPISLVAGGSDSRTNIIAEELGRRIGVPDQRLVSNLIALSERLTPELPAGGDARSLIAKLAEHVHIKEIESCCVAMLGSQHAEIRGLMLAALKDRGPTSSRLLEAVRSTIQQGESGYNLERAVAILPAPLEPAVIGQIERAAAGRSQFERESLALRLLRTLDKGMPSRATIDCIRALVADHAPGGFIVQDILDALAQAGGAENVRLLERCVPFECSGADGARAALERAGTVEALAALHRGLPWLERGAAFGAPFAKLRVRFLRGGEGDADRDIRDLCAYARFPMPMSMGAPTFYALAKANDRRATDLLVRQLFSPGAVVLGGLGMRSVRCELIAEALKASEDPRVPSILKRYAELRQVADTPSRSMLAGLVKTARLVAETLYEKVTAARRKP